MFGWRYFKELESSKERIEVKDFFIKSFAVFGVFMLCWMLFAGVLALLGVGDNF